MAAEFFARTSNRESLITITNAALADDMASVVIYFTVLPQDKENNALAFAKRQRNDFRIYIKRPSRLPRIPKIDFDIDAGEKNRQRITDLINQDAGGKPLES